MDAIRKAGFCSCHPTPDSDLHRRICPLNPAILRSVDAAGVGHQFRQFLGRWSCWSWPPTPPTPASLETPPLGGDTVLLPVHHRLVELRGLVVQWWCKGGAMQTSKRYKIEINDFHFRDTSSRAFFPHSWWGMGSVTHAPPAAGAQRPGGEWVAE